MKHLYTISFEILAGITLEAESEEQAIAMFEDDPDVLQKILDEMSYTDRRILDIQDEGETDD